MKALCFALIWAIHSSAGSQRRTNAGAPDRLGLAGSADALPRPGAVKARGAHQALSLPGRPGNARIAGGLAVVPITVLCHIRNPEPSDFTAATHQGSLRGMEGDDRRRLRRASRSRRRRFRRRDARKAIIPETGSVSVVRASERSVRRRPRQDCVAFSSTSAHAPAKLPSGFSAAGTVAQPAFMTNSLRS